MADTLEGGTEELNLFYVYGEDLKEYVGDDPAGQFCCPKCNRGIYCTDETPGGVFLYECQYCQNTTKVIG